MTFTSFLFLLVLPLVVIVYNMTPNNKKNVLLLLLSYAFYINLQPIYALLLLLETVITFFSGKKISLESNDNLRNRYLTLSILLLLFPLVFFKYFKFLNELIASIFSLANINLYVIDLGLALPIGISFYTFMSIGYLVDIRNEDVNYEKSFINTALFLSFFPIVLSGPIERATNIFPQLNNLKESKAIDISEGIKLMIWGYFMKLCVADRVGVYIDTIFSNLENHSGNSIILASLLSPIQFYADLGGYSLIVIGVSRLFGIHIIPNFRRPFFATSMSDLWRRWHMSLIHWITDYIFTPLSFSFRKFGMWGLVISIVFAFLISGVWHGASINFVVWGVLQGILISIEATTNKTRSTFEKKYKLTDKWWYISLCCVIVYILFSFTGLYDRCLDVSRANVAISKLFEGGNLFIDNTTLIFSFVSIMILFIKDFIDEFASKQINCFKSNHIHSYNIIHFIIYIFIFTTIINIGVLDNSQFIYFQF